MNPLVSIIIPVYRTEDYLEKCVDSIIHQTYRNLEIILIDDGSPDKCGEICDRYALSDKRVRVIHKENGGLSSARNAGMDVCKGDYIAFVDSDDFCSPVYIEAMYRGMKRYGSEVATLVHYPRFPEGEEEKVVLSQSMKEVRTKKMSPREVIRLMMYQKVPAAFQFKMCKREVCEGVRCPTGWVYEDAATSYQFFLNATSATLVDGMLYAFRVRQDSQTRMPFKPIKLTAALAADRVFTGVTAYDPTLTAAASHLAFSVCYTVFLQIPFEEKEYRRKMWKEVLKYRDAVLKDTCSDVRFKNRAGAVISFLGMDAAWKIGRKATGKE